MTKSTKTGATGKSETQAAADSLRSAFQAGAEGFDAVLKDGGDAAARGFQKFTATSREGIENTVQRYDEAVAFGRANLDAFAISAEAVVKAAEEINSEILGYSQKTVAAGMGATEAALGAKDPADAARIQREFWHTGIAGFFEESARLGEIALAAANRSLAPLNDRISQVVRHATRTES